MAQTYGAQSGVLGRPRWSVLDGHGSGEAAVSKEVVRREWHVLLWTVWSCPAPRLRVGERTPVLVPGHPCLLPSKQGSVWCSARLLQGSTPCPPPRTRPLPPPPPPTLVPLRRRPRPTLGHKQDPDHSLKNLGGVDTTCRPTLHAWSSRRP